MHCRLQLKRDAFNRLANDATDSLSVRISAGKLFHVTCPATAKSAKLRSPKEIRVLGTWRTPVAPNRSCQRPGRVDTAWSTKLGQV